MKSIKAKNLSAQLRYRAAGNPPSTEPASAISNSFPGLEMDFRNVWRRIFVGIQLHEAGNLVVEVDKEAKGKVAKLLNHELREVGGQKVVANVTGPQQLGGPSVPLGTPAEVALEWSNALAEVLDRYAEKTVPCVFRAPQRGKSVREVRVELVVRQFFQHELIENQWVKLGVISKELARPGDLSQSLCSPWQNDYRECSCFYWAASRPDYVNVEPTADGTSNGNNWLQKRTDQTPREYIKDDFRDPRLVTYVELFKNWENQLKFIIGGKDHDL